MNNNVFSKKFLHAVKKEPYISLLHVKDGKGDVRPFLRVARMDWSIAKYVVRKFFNLNKKNPLQVLKNAVRYRKQTIKLKERRKKCKKL